MSDSPTSICILLMKMNGEREGLIFNRLGIHAQNLDGIDGTDNVRITKGKSHRLIVQENFDCGNCDVEFCTGLFSRKAHENSEISPR